MPRQHTNEQEIQDPSSLLIREVHAIVRDLLKPNLALYLCDFLITITLVYLSLAVFLQSENFSVVQILSFIVTAISMYRASAFIHEIEHQRSSSFRSFVCLWNLLWGVPFFMPSFLYDDHVSHHSNMKYGTNHDSEYLSLSKQRTYRSLGMLFGVLLKPFFGPVRFILLTPLSLLSRRVDRFVWSRFSCIYAFNWLLYRRPYDASAMSYGRWVQEIATWIFAWSAVSLCVFEIIPFSVLFKVYLVTAFWMFVNQLRTLAAHSYRRYSESTSYAEQMLDSNTFDRGGLLTELWAPVGLRYHALHHIMPSLPYHSMGMAHRRLLRQLPVDSLYRRTLQRSLRATLIKNLFTGRGETGVCEVADHPHKNDTAL